MARTTRGMLQSRVDYLNKLCGFDAKDSIYRYELEYWQPGGNTHTWKLILSARVQYTPTSHGYNEIRTIPNDRRFRAEDLYYVIQGVIYGIESATKPGLEAWRMYPTHREVMMAQGITDCAARHIAPGGHCLNCGWQPHKA
jgi:hypothetical protein